MRWLIAACGLGVTSVAVAAPAWTVAETAPLPGVGYRAVRMTPLDDGRLMFDPGGPPLVLSADGTTWQDVSQPRMWGSGPDIPIGGGRVLNLMSSGGALVWDLATGTATRTGDLLVRRIHNEELSIALADGGALVVGGQHADTNDVIDNPERWRPTTGAFERAGVLRSPRTDGTLTRLPDGRVLLAGGATTQGRGGWLAQADVFDPVKSVWKPTGGLHIARRGHTATLLPDGRVLVAGGQNAKEAAAGELEVWDPKHGAWTIVGTLREPRAYHAAVLLPGPRVMFIGGTTHGDRFETLENGIGALTAETWDPIANRWEAPFYPPHGYHTPVAAVLRDGRVVVAGGYAFTTPLRRVEIWTPAAPPTTPPRWELAPTPPDPVDDAFELDPPTLRQFTGGSWRTIKLPPFDWDMTIAPLGGGRALAVGRSAATRDGLRENQVTGASLWDPTTATWTSVPIHRRRTAAVVLGLADGRVLIAGGVGEVPPSSMRANGPPTPLAELLDPATGRSSFGGSMTRPRAWAAGARLADGRVLITGGHDATTDLWSPRTREFTRAAPMHVDRTGHTATRLPDGRVVVIGGNERSATYEIYDPARNRWSDPQPLPEVWRGHRARLAPDGRILVTVGGRSVLLRP